MSNSDPLDDKVRELKDYLRSANWAEDSTVEVVVDGLVRHFKDSSELSNLLDSISSYDELAQNQGVGSPPQLDERAKKLLGEIQDIINRAD